MNNKYSMVIGGLIMSSFAVGGTYINKSVEIVNAEVLEAESSNTLESTETENTNQTEVKNDEATENTADNTKVNAVEDVKPDFNVNITPKTALSNRVEEYVANLPVQIEYVKRSTYTGAVPNEMNEVIIAMYHGIGENVSSSDEVHRSVEGFKKDLQTLYDNGYRAITLTDLMNNNINVPAGYTPIVLTFDDGLSNQFSFVKDEAGNLVPKKDTAVDIINEFNETHTGFGTNATFFVYSSQRPFKGEGTVDDCFNYLIERGYEIGSHTYSHPFLSSLSEDEIKKQLAYNVGYIAKHSASLEMEDVKYLAYPYGDVPDASYNNVLLTGAYQEFMYGFDAGLVASPNFKNSTLTYANNFDKYKVGRYRGTDNANYDLMFKVRQDQKHLENKFVSDGDANVVTILEKDFTNVNLDSLKGKKLVVITE